MRYLLDKTRKLQHLFGNYSLLTLAMILMMLLRPFLDESGEGGVMTDMMFALLFASGIYAVRKEAYGYRLAIFLAIIGFAGRIKMHFSEEKIMPVFANLASMLFFLHALTSVGSFVWNQRHRVNHDVIWAAINVYLLLGLIWAYGYEFLELANPRSFRGPDPNIPLNRDDFFYFSYVTLATLGYGDILPATRSARAIAILEALTGQLYLAILVARLVGAYVGKSDSDSKR